MRRPSDGSSLVPSLFKVGHYLGYNERLEEGPARTTRHTLTTGECAVDCPWRGIFDTIGRREDIATDARVLQVGYYGTPVSPGTEYIVVARIALCLVP